jgi:periplasmic divalent cation tolerance protein
MEALLVLTTCPHDVATELARTLVHQKLAACVNILPTVQAIYRWHDAVEENKETLLFIKTTTSRYESLEKEILKLHPYETPEILAIPTSHASSTYLSWIVSSCSE